MQEKLENVYLDNIVHEDLIVVQPSYWAFFTNSAKMEIYASVFPLV